MLNGRYLWVLLLLAWLAACAGPAAPPTPPPDTLRQEQTVNGLTIILDGVNQPQINQTQRFVVTLRDAQGRGIDGADVYLDLDMPAMPMGTNRPEAEPLGNGVYTASTAYTMSGEWTVTVVATVNGSEYRATFVRQVEE